MKPARGKRTRPAADGDKALRGDVRVRSKSLPATGGEDHGLRAPAPRAERPRAKSAGAAAAILRRQHAA